MASGYDSGASVPSLPLGDPTKAWDVPSRKHLLRFILSLLYPSSFCSSSCCPELCYKTHSMSDLSVHFVARLARH